MNLDGTVIYYSLEGGCSHVGLVLIQVVWSSAFAGRGWIWCGHKSCLSSGDAGSYFGNGEGRGGAGDGGAGTGARWEVGFPLYPTAIIALLGLGSDPSCWSRSLEGLGPAGSFPLSMCFPLLATEGSVLKQGTHAIEVWCAACADVYSSAQTQFGE